MRGWLRQKQDQVLPGSALGKAIAFALGQWRKLICYLDHPQLTPDNNSCEQAIRPFVIGRKNWLFSRQPARRHRKRTLVEHRLHLRASLSCEAVRILFTVVG